MLSDDESDICKFSISFEKYFFDRLWRSFFCERYALLFDRSLVWRWEYNVAGFYSIDDELSLWFVLRITCTAGRLTRV
jgi:hypothetical protein